MLRPALQGFLCTWEPIQFTLGLKTSMLSYHTAPLALVQGCLVNRTKISVINRHHRRLSRRTILKFACTQAEAMSRGCQTFPNTTWFFSSILFVRAALCWSLRAHLCDEPNDTHACVASADMVRKYEIEF